MGNISTFVKRSNIRRDIWNLIMNDQYKEFVERLPHEHDLKYKQLVESTATAERAAGTVVNIDYTLPSIEISREGEVVYHFQEHSALKLLASVPDGLTAEDYLLYAQSDW